jgi:plasmid replication initiation protein
MAQKQLTLPGELVKKDNYLVRAKININNVTSSKILASLIACIGDDKQFKEAYHIPAKELLPDTGGGSYRQIKAICSELSKATAEFETPEIFDVDKPGEISFVAIPFFSRVQYRKGIISGTFNSDMMMVECLLALKEKFTAYNLIEYLKLPSIYSQRIYEILKSWSNTHPEYTYSLDELHHMLNTPESLRNDFRNFRLRVLEKAHKDINEKTELYFDWEPVKQGRAVVAIRFTFGGKKLALLQKKKVAEGIKATSTESDKIFNAAVACSQAKGGKCAEEDGKPDVCAVCRRFDMVKV